MNNKLKILRFLLENRNKTFSINQISKSLKINYKIIFDDIKNLEKEKLIQIKKLGNSNQCSFNNSFSHRIMQVENIRKSELLKNQDVNVLHNDLNQVKNPFFILLVFGSYAKNIQTKSSDIDLCLITDNKKINQTTNQILSTIPLKIHLLEFTTDEFSQMLITKKENVGKEILNNNIILHGIENFYNLIKNA